MPGMITFNVLFFNCRSSFMCPSLLLLSISQVQGGNVGSHDTMKIFLQPGDQSILRPIQSHYFMPESSTQVTVRYKANEHVPPSEPIHVSKNFLFLMLNKSQCGIGWTSSLDRWSSYWLWNRLAANTAKRYWKQQHLVFLCVSPSSASANADVEIRSIRTQTMNMLIRMSYSTRSRHHTLYTMAIKGLSKYICIFLSSYFRNLIF